MTARILIACDAVRAERTPPACRAFLATDTVYETVAFLDAERAGWTQDIDGTDRCPSCSRGAA